METKYFNIGGATFAQPLGRNAKVITEDNDLNYLSVKLKKTFPKQANTYGRISGITIEEQSLNISDGTKKDISSFSFNGDDLNYDGDEINLEYVEFFDKFIMRRNSGSGGTGDASDRFSVESLLLDRDNLNEIIDNVEIMESISDTYDIPIDDEIQKRKSFKEINYDKLNQSNGLGWNLKDLGATEIQLLEMNVEIRFYFKGVI